MKAHIVSGSEKDKVQGRVTAMEVSAILELLIKKGVFTREEFKKGVKKKLVEQEMFEILLNSALGKPVVIPVKDLEEEE